MFGGRQRGQINVQPQPFLLKVVAQGAAFTPKQGFTAAPQLNHVFRREGIQRPRQIGLAGKVRPSPSLSQGQVRSQTRIDLINSSTPRQNTDQYIQQFVVGGMVNFLQGQTEFSEQESVAEFDPWGSLAGFERHFAR
jgi:hypothetical protein